MGAGIAQVSAAAGGLNVVMVDASSAALTKALGGIGDSLRMLARKEAKKAGVAEAGPLATAEAALGRIKTAESLSSLAACDLVIEAVPETMAIKTPVYTTLAGVLRRDAILASNTSGLSIAALAAIAQRPATTIGLHFFNPVPLMALVEVVKLGTTDPDVLAAAVAYVQAVKKTPVVCGDTPGFVVNRLLVPYLAQAIALADAGGASHKDIDVAMQLGTGVPMVGAVPRGGRGGAPHAARAARVFPPSSPPVGVQGPIHLADYVGLDTTMNVLKNWGEAMPADPTFRVPKSLAEKVAAGQLGRKTGQVRLRCVCAECACMPSSAPVVAVQPCLHPPRLGRLGSSLHCRATTSGRATRS